MGTIYIFAYRLHLVVNIHLIICIYVFVHVASCHPISLLTSPMRRVALDSTHKKEEKPMVLGVINYI